MQWSEYDIIQGLRNNNQKAFEEVYNLFFTRLFYFSNGITNSAEDTEEIVQDVFAKLWERRANFETLENIKAFLFIATKNASINYVRYKKTTVPELIEEGEEMKLRILEADLLDMIYRQAQCLPEKTKEIFTLTYKHDLRANEIAEQLGCTVSTVTSQRHNAINQIRNSLTQKT